MLHTLPLKAETPESEDENSMLSKGKISECMIKEINLSWHSEDRRGMIEQQFSNLIIYMNHLRILLTF